MRGVCLAVLLLGCLRSTAAVNHTLTDSKLSATFGGDAGNLGSLYDLHRTGGTNVLTGASGEVWSATFVGTGTGGTRLSSTRADCRSQNANASKSSVVFSWLECTVNLRSPDQPSAVNVTLEVTLADGMLGYYISFQSNGTLAMWDYLVQIGGIATSNSTAYVQDKGVGQLTGLYDPTGVHDAVYFAAHDPRHNDKQCRAGGGYLHCNMVVPNATVPLYLYEVGFAYAVTVIPNGDWWDLASTYRQWMASGAEWTAGLLDSRSDLPDWLENITLWMNNNWGGDPLRPNYGGDPEHVKLEFLAVNDRLKLPGHGGVLGLHWYEWDTLGYELGSNHTKCDRTGAPCGFDTHYPNYFPARVGCKEAIAAMQSAGMRVIPYINGQLYDTLIPRYKEDNAYAAVQKYSEQKILTAGPTLTPHLEHFDGITSAVMDPATVYWQKVMRETIIEIVNDLGFDGCYVDQVGNGEQRLSFDPTHNHTIGGGSFWHEAFQQIITDVKQNVKPRSTMYMTEGIVEQVAGKAFDILLGLEWSSTSGPVLPIWHAVYGGFTYATGHAGSIRSPLGGGLAGELTKQFMVGGTMGWLTYQNYGTTWLDEKNAKEVDYIVALSAARISAKAWMVHGRATRLLSLNDSTGTLESGCFLRERPSESNSVVCAVALPQSNSSATFTLSMEPARYGLEVSAGKQAVVEDLLTEERLGSYDGTITYSATVAAFTVRLLKITVQ